MSKALLIFVITTCTFAISQAQDVKTDTIKWNSVNTLVESNTVQTMEITSLITYGTSRIEWSQTGSATRRIFQISEAMGEWVDVNQEGWLQYEVTDGISNGTIAVRRYETETKVFITIASEPLLSCILTIGGHEVL
jgi:hypothetical protein